MKLFYSPGACSLAPHIALCEAGLSVSLEKVDLGKHHYAQGDFTKVNAKGYVPTVALDDGQVLTEGVAIMTYIADQKPESMLMPKTGSFERYRAIEWLNFISTELHKGFSPLFNSKLPEEVRTQFKDKLGTRLDYVENHLKTHQLLMGSQFTVLDGYLFTILNWAPMVKLDLKKWPSIMSYIERVKGRPNVQKAMREEGLL